MKVTFKLPSAAFSSAKIMQTSAMKTCFQIAECRFFFCKDNANERNENLFSDCRVPLFLLQR